MGGFDLRIGWRKLIRSIKSPGGMSGAFSLLTPRKPQVRVRIRIMKLSKLSSATCIHNSESVR